MALPTAFPALPAGQGPLNDAVEHAYHIISETYGHSLGVFYEDGADLIRLQFHIDRV